MLKVLSLILGPLPIQPILLIRLELREQESKG